MEAQHLHAQSYAEGEWSTGFCDCFSDFRTCCIACWCPCITFGQIADIVDRGSTTCGTAGALYTLITALTGCGCIYSCFYGKKMRAQYNIRGDDCGDCLKHSLPKLRELPFELVVEILARVRVKDLIRFRCVCKRWRSLFQDERFIRWHMSHAPRKILSHNGRKVPLCNFIYESDNKAILEEVDLNIGDKSLLPRARVIGHCHGLFCLDLRDNSIGIWNPSLRELRRIPPGRHIDTWAEIGFGYDHSTQDYKIVMLIPPHSSKAQVLSLKSGLSRMIHVPCFQNADHVMRQRGALVGGENIYWHVFCDGKLNLAGTMLSFNLVSETFNYSPGPITGDKPLPLVLGEFRGGLCTIGIEDGKLGDELVIWSATHDEKGVIKSWSNILRLSWGIIESSISPRVDISWLRSAATYEGSSLLLLVAGVGRETKLLAYNFEENSFRLVETSLPVGTIGRLHTYMETLVPIPPAALIN